MKGKVLIIAGSDSGGGAGIQADIKTVTALGGYAATAITALTAQNTQGVFGVHDVPPAFIRQQIDLVLDDIGADAIKTGMLANEEIIESVAASLREKRGQAVLVVDPVMVAKGGAPLLQIQALEALKRHLIAHADLITPNAPEAALLTGRPVESADHQTEAAFALLDLGAKAVLLKGGHIAGSQVRDVLAWQGGSQEFVSDRIPSRNTHGTGCTLASAIACRLAQGFSLCEAVEQARNYVAEAIRTAPNFGHGHGPLNHGHCIVG